MQIVRTHLVNTCQHANLKVEFSPGLVGVYGRNGTGKSNLLNVGAYANLTNDYSRTKGPRAKCIRRDIGDADPSYYETWWEHNGTKFSIRRDLRRESHQLTIFPETPGGEAKKMTGAKEIQAWLEATLKIRRQVIDNYLFVEQMQMVNFIDQTPAARAETFAHLCGTTYMSKIYDALGDRIKADLPLSGDVTDNSDELRARVGEALETRRKAKKALASCQDKLLPADLKKSLLSRLAERRQYVSVRKQYQEEVSALAELVAREVEAKELSDNAQTATKAAAKLAESTAPAAEEAKQLLKDIEAANARQQRYKKLQELLAGLIPPTKPTKKPEFSVRDAAALKAERLRLDKAERLVATFDAGAVECPLCGTQTPELDHHVEESREMLEWLPKKIADLEFKEHAWADYKLAVSRYELKLQSYREQKDNTEANLADLGPMLVTDESLDWTQLQQAVDSHKTAKARASKAEEAYVTANRNWCVKQDAIERLKERVQSLKEKSDALKVSKAAAESAEAQLAEHEAASLEAAALGERIAGATKLIHDAETDLQSLEAARARTGQVKLWLNELTTLREEVFHRTKLPQLLHEDALEELVGTVNTTLAEIFCDPFSVRVGDGLAFTAIKPDGEEDVQRLSGGQKAVLAIAFRLAINSIFAGEVGMMVLDEPTVGLDEENIDCLHTALTSLSSFASSQGSQIIIITHDKRLETAFDRVIKL